MSSLPPGTPTRVAIIPVLGAPDTAPPASPGWLAAKRCAQLVLPLLPIVATVLLDAITRGDVKIDPKWAGLVTTLLVCIQVVAKQQTEADRQQAALLLQAHGVPAGQSLPAAAVERALNSPATLGSASTSTGPPHG